MGIEKISIISILMILSGVVDARPISYPGGSTIMGRHDALQNSLYYHYSPTYKLAIGLETVNDYTFDETYSLVRMTYLLHRKNTAQSQRNLYLAGGVSPEGPQTHFYRSRRVSPSMARRGQRSFARTLTQVASRTLMKTLGRASRLTSAIMAIFTPGLWPK